LGSQSDWFTFARKTSERPFDIPARPQEVYAGKGWSGWGDWLGTGNIAPKNRIYRSFEEAKAFVQDLGLRSQREWKAYIKTGDLPPDIPAHPEYVYRDAGWSSLGDWLGTGTIASRGRTFRRFEEARLFARRLKLTSAREWLINTRTMGFPSDLPKRPDKIYEKQGWVNWADWLGTEHSRRSPRGSADNTSKAVVPSHGSSATSETEQTST
jgi:hypothetical protein